MNHESWIIPSLTYTRMVTLLLVTNPACLSQIGPTIWEPISLNPPRDRDPQTFKSHLLRSLGLDKLQYRGFLTCTWFEAFFSQGSLQSPPFGEHIPCWGVLRVGGVLCLGGVLRVHCVLRVGEVLLACGASRLKKPQDWWCPPRRRFPPDQHGRPLRHKPHAQPLGDRVEAPVRSEDLGQVCLHVRWC